MGAGRRVGFGFCLHFPPWLPTEQMGGDGRTEPRAPFASRSRSSAGALSLNTPARPPGCASANPGAAPTPPPPGLFSCHQPSVSHFFSRELARRSESPGKRPPLPPQPDPESRDAERDCLRGRRLAGTPDPAPTPLVRAAGVGRRGRPPAIGGREQTSSADGGRAAEPGASGPRGAAVTRLGPAASREGGKEGGRARGRGKRGLKRGRPPAEGSRGGGRCAAARRRGPRARRTEQRPPASSSSSMRPE